MSRIIRIVGISIVSLILLLIIGAFVATKLINPNNYKSEIIDSVNKATGRELAINGDISLSFFPWLGVDIQNVQLSNPAGFSEQAFAKIGEAEVKLRLLPLLLGKIELSTIVLNNADLNLIKTASANNWSSFNVDAENEPPPPSLEKKTNSIKFKDINISSLSIHNANLHYNDQLSHEKIELTQFNFDGSKIGMAKFFPVNLSFNFKSKDPKLAVQFNANTEAYFDPDAKLYQLKSLKANGQLSTATANNLSFAVSGDLKVDLNKQSWSANKFKANLAQFVVNLKAQGDLKDSSGSGSISIKPFNARNLLEQLNPGMKFENTTVLNSVGIEFSYTMDSALIKVADFEATVDQSHLNGDLAYSYKNNRSLNFNLVLDQLNLDQYKTVNTGSSAASTVKSNQPVAGNDQILPLSFLKNLEAKGKFQAGSLTLNQVTLKKVLVKVNAHANTINLNPINAMIYQGSANGQVSINLQSSIPALSGDLNLSDLNLSEAAVEKMSGIFSLKTHINTLGNSMPAWLNNLQGSGNLTVIKGVLKGVDLNYWLKQGIAVLNKQVPSLSGNTNQTPFSDMQATYVIHQGVLSNQDLQIASSGFKAKGSGSINLTKQNINYRVFASLNDTSTDKNWQIPIIISGSLESPKVELDMASLSRSLLKNEIQGQITNVNESVKASVSDLLSKIKF